MQAKQSCNISGVGHYKRSCGQLRVSCACVATVLFAEGAACGECTGAFAFCTSRNCSVQHGSPQPTTSLATYHNDVYALGMASQVGQNAMEDTYLTSRPCILLMLLREALQASVQRQGRSSGGATPLHAATVLLKSCQHAELHKLFFKYDRQCHRACVIPFWHAKLEFCTCPPLAYTPRSGVWESLSRNPMLRVPLHFCPLVVLVGLPLGKVTLHYVTGEFLSKLAGWSTQWRSVHSFGILRCQGAVGRSSSVNPAKFIFRSAIELVFGSCASSWSTAKVSSCMTLTAN
eukprot:423598-Amphidinium_carterae.1